MNSALSSLQGIFGFAAIIVGAFTSRPKKAAIWGVVVGAICAALLVAIAMNAGLSISNNSEFAGRIIGGPILGCVLMALLGYGIKRLFRRRKPEAASDSAGGIQKS
jgi:ABC-type uncharacterized transport system permease subunit